MRPKLVSTQLALTFVAGWLLTCNSAHQSTRVTKQNTETVMEHPTPPPPTLLSSQKGPGDSQVDLLKAQVTDNILTVELQYKPGSEDKHVSSTYAIDQVVVTDETTAKTYSVLKDQSGTYMASPVRTDQGKQQINIDLSSSKDKPVAVWFKFPAPPVDTKAISISIPEVGTYKEIPVSR